MGFSRIREQIATIGKPNFPENTLVYVNNGSIMPAKGDHAIYLKFIIIGQILPMANPPPGIDLDKYEFKESKALICTPLYNTENGLYRGLTKNRLHNFEE